MQDMKRGIATLHALKNLGVQLAMDDFGTGYSSLSYLKRFPIDRLKIDRSFVQDLTTDPDNAAITEAVTALAHTMGLQVIAEGWRPRRNWPSSARDAVMRCKDTTSAPRDRRRK